ncbi:MAG: tRNA (adenosine(37)-N6)-threonylcarbamoyltransferase complex dimerization subunit type 1 TsaB [Pseudomonadota bacterium]
MSCRCVFAIDTTSTHASIALRHGDTVLETSLAQAGSHASVLMQAIDSILDQARVSPSQLDGIVYGQGPGSFPGVRIGIAVAQGLAHAHAVPMMGVCSLENIAWQASSDITALGSAHVAIDARMGELYVREFQRHADQLVPLGDSQLVAIEQFPDASVRHILGNAPALYRDLAARAASAGIGVSHSQLLPSARTAMMIAMQSDHAWHSPAQAQAVYVRQHVADKLGEGKRR